MPRNLILALALASCVASETAQARLFWQTYGATVPSYGGNGCAWNINQDYFVPRHCHTGRYGLFSDCKTAHSISPACKNLHPLYAGYCTPYGPCRYRWRDHVYQTYCGCGPLGPCHDGWHLKSCCEHPLVLKHSNEGSCSCPGEYHEDGLAFHDSADAAWNCLCNVEPFGGEVLGSISALSASSTIASGPAATAGAPAQPVPPRLNAAPGAAPTGGLPAPFNF